MLAGRARRGTGHAHTALTRLGPSPAAMLGGRGTTAGGTVVDCIPRCSGGRAFFSTRPLAAAPATSHQHGPSSTAAAAARLVTWGWGHHGQLGIAGVPLTHTKSAYFPQEITLDTESGKHEGISAIGCGHFHAFAVTEENHVYGWGMNEHHQLLGNHADNVDVPTRLDCTLSFLQTQPRPKIKQITGSGVSSALVLEYASGTELWTWGSSLYALAHAPTFPKKKRAAFSPSKVLGLEGIEIADLALGWGHGLALTSNKQLYAWGWGKNGQLGLGDYDNKPLPTLVSTISDTPIESLAVGPDCSAVVSEEGEVYFWGRNEYWMQIKVAWAKGGETMGENVPIKVAFPEKTKITQVRCGYGHLVALDEQGRAWSWGLNKNGQLGLGNTEEHQEPHLVRFFVDEGMRVTHVRCGRVHTVFVTDDGNVWTCGSGVYGRLGHGDKEDQVNPTLVEALIGTRVIKIECGYDFNVALVVPHQ